MIQLTNPINQGINRQATYYIIYEKDIRITKYGIFFSLVPGIVENNIFDSNPKLNTISVAIRDSDFNNISLEYPGVYYGVINNATNNTVIVPEIFIVNLKDAQITITDGMGINQKRKIISSISNIDTTITIDMNWDIIPDVTSRYYIIHNFYNLIANKLYQYCIDKGLIEGVIE